MKGTVTVNTWVALAWVALGRLLTSMHKCKTLLPNVPRSYTSTRHCFPSSCPGSVSMGRSEVQALQVVQGRCKSAGVDRDTHTILVSPPLPPSEGLLFDSWWGVPHYSDATSALQGERDASKVRLLSGWTLPSPGPLAAAVCGGVPTLVRTCLFVDCICLLFAGVVCVHLTVQIFCLLLLLLLLNSHLEP